MSGARLNVRALAAQALVPVLAGKGSLSETLPSALAACRAEDKGLLQALCFTAARHGLHYRAILKPLLAKSPEPLIEALLWVGLAQLRELRVPDHAAIGETVEAARQLGRAKFTGLLNAILRRYQREKDELEARAHAQHHAHPDWLVQQLRRDWGAAANEVLTANNTEAPLTLRVNRRQHQPCRLCPAVASASALSASRVCTRRMACGLRQWGMCASCPALKKAWFSVQDEAAQLAAVLLAAQPGQRVLDACAAPGGKTAHLLERSPDCHGAGTGQRCTVATNGCARICGRLQLAGRGSYGRCRDTRALWWEGHALRSHPARRALYGNRRDSPSSRHQAAAPAQ
jgi:16S rRNA (cytosine967-C5)-methyltransferase